MIISQSTLRIAWRNLGRNRRRTCLAIGAIALGQVTLVFVNCMMAGSFHTMLNTITGPLLGDVQVHHPSWPSERAPEHYVAQATALAQELAAVEGVASVSSRVYAAVLAAAGDAGPEAALAEPAMLVGVEPEAAMQPGGLLEYLPPDQRPGAGRVLLGQVLARRLGLKPGARLALIGQDCDGFPASDLYQVSGIIASSVEMVNRMGVILSRHDAGHFLAMPDQVHEIILRGVDSSTAPKLAENLRTLPSLAGYEVLSWQETSPEFAQMMAMKTWIDLIFLAILFIAAAAGIANTAMMSTFERIHEFGLLLAMGAAPRRITSMVLLESLLLGLGGVLLGSLLGAAAVLITAHTGINYAALADQAVDSMAYKGLAISYTIYPRFEWRHVLFGLVAVTLTSVVASVWPAIIAARLHPAEAMRR